METCYLQLSDGTRRTAGSEGSEVYVVPYTCKPKETKRPESTIAVMAVLGCQLDYVWNELQSRDGEHTSERFESESFLL